MLSVTYSVTWLYHELFRELPGGKLTLDSPQVSLIFRLNQGEVLPGWAPGEGTGRAEVRDRVRLQMRYQLPGSFAIHSVRPLPFLGTPWLCLLSFLSFLQAHSLRLLTGTSLKATWEGGMELNITFRLWQGCWFHRLPGAGLSTSSSERGDD